MIGRRHIYKVQFCELRSADVREVEATRVCAASRAARQNADAELAAALPRAQHPARPSQGARPGRVAAVI
jgi:hypothetical protein